MADSSTGESYVFTKEVRAPFLTVVAPEKVGKRGQGKGDPVFSATLLLPPDSPDLAELKKVLAAVAKAAFPGRSLSELKFPLQNGDEAAAEAEKNGKDGSFFKGMVVLRARSGQEKPPALGVIQGGKIVELQGEQRRIIGKEKFYGGCFVVPSLWLKAYKGGKDGGIGEHSGVKCYLQSLLWRKDGPKIGGGSIADTFKGYMGGVSAEDPTSDADEIPF